MTDTRKFYITEITVKVLAADAPWDGNLQWLSHDVTQGEYVGDFTRSLTTEVTEAEMAEALVDAGSDPEFFEVQAETSGRNKQTYIVTQEGVE